MQSTACLAVLLGLVCFVASAGNENARLLASKTILNNFLVEGKDLTVEYNIYNVGGRLVNYICILETCVFFYQIYLFTYISYQIVIDLACHTVYHIMYHW